MEREKRSRRRVVIDLNHAVNQAIEVGGLGPGERVPYLLAETAAKCGLESSSQPVSTAKILNSTASLVTERKPRRRVNRCSAVRPIKHALETPHECL